MPGPLPSGSCRTVAMLEHLLTEQRNPASEGIDALPSEEIVRIINREDHKVAGAVERVLATIARAVDVIVGAFERARRLFFVRAGPTGALCVPDAAVRRPTSHVPPRKSQG